MKRGRHFKAHGHDTDGKAFWIGPSGAKHYDYYAYLEDIENDIRNDVIN